MKTNDNKAVSEFLVRNLPQDLVEGLNILSHLKFPIPDKRTFGTALGDPEGNKHKSLLMQMLTPQDFPILSTENAFEKYFVKFPFPPIDLPDFTVQPSACDVYRRTFSSFAADCACRAFGEALRVGFNSLQATLIGHFAGRRAESTGRCPD